ncbi:MAG: transglycosylase domain-containing protein [Candidatus Paceibacteria bacterium]
MFGPRFRGVFVGLVSIGFFVGGAVFIWAATFKIPDIESLQSRKVAQSTKIYDRTGEVLLYDLHEDVDRTVVPIADISLNIRNATVAIEDSTFYEHNGIRPIATLRAVFLQPLRGRGVQGGSTITQQVVKNSVLTSKRLVSRKIIEWVVALRLESVLSKDDILELYLNESPYGGTIYGVEEAAQSFFGKSASDVTLVEAAYLAALPQAPTYYSPYGNNREDLEERKNLVLSRMRELGFITEEEYATAMGEEVKFKTQVISGIRAPHFVFYVREQLEREFGRRTLEESGWKVVTTIDMELQEAAEATVANHAETNEKNFRASNAAMVATDPKTGDILAMVGSRDYFDDEIDGNYNVATAKPGRQPGSAFKPFVYAAAFDRGLSPNTVLFDVKTQFSTACRPDDLSEEAPCYSPNNYDEVFKGPVTLRSALAESRNVPAVKLLYLVGLSDALRTARAMGITTLENEARYGLTLVLGGGEVTPLEMTAAYGVFAAEGMKRDTRSILKVEDRNGNEVRTYPVRENRVLKESVALAVSDVLSDNEARTPEFGANSPLYFPGQHVAAKTGTTNDSRDAWIIGYTPNIAVGAWVGNNDNSEMVKEIAGFIVAPMWHEFMEFALAKYPNDPFPEAKTTTVVDAKPILNGIWEGVDIQEDPSGVLRITADIHSILNWIDKRDPHGPRPEDPAQDPQFAYWELAVEQWKMENNYRDGMVLFRNP